MNSEQKNPVVEIRKTVHATLPRVRFDAIARTILGARYRLSLVICGDSLARKLNRTYSLPAEASAQAGKKNYAANVLSFPLDTKEGEIFLNANAAAREAKQFGVSLRARLTLLFTHGCLHLKGMRHGTKMEKLEEETLRKFS